MSAGTGSALLAALGAALAVAAPAALAAQVLDALDDGPDTPTAVLLLAPIVLAGALVGGLVAGHRRPSRPALVGAAAAVVALSLVLALGVARRGVADEPVAWSGVAATLATGAALGAVGALVGTRRAGRKRP